MRSTSPIWTCSALILAACGSAPDRDTPANVAIPDVAANMAVDVPNGATGNEAAASAPVSPPGATASATPRPGTIARTGPAPAAHDAMDYRAVGTEPFWAVSIRGDMLIFEEPGAAPRRLPVSRQEKGGVLRYWGNGIALTAQPAPCSDGMSDRDYPDQVQLTLGARTFKGCGNPSRNE